MNDTITIVGNIVTPPERKVTPAGLTITSFRVASSQRRYDRGTGGWIDGHTNFYGVSTFRSLAEHAYESLQKGQRVIVAGKFRLREWENTERKGVSAEIDADAVGHDLLWGTATFHRDHAVAAPADPVEADDTAGAQPPVAEWATAPVPAGATAEAATPF